MLFSLTVSVLGGGGLCLAAPGRIASNALHQAATARTSTADGYSTACGDIIDRANRGQHRFHASDAHNCLISIPFDPAVATRFVKYWNETMQFQSTLAYLKNPPAGYQQPAVDVEAGLASIQTRIDNGTYTNEYAFEADLQALVYSLHDAHVDMSAGALSAFTFGSGWSLTSASVDGKSPPKVFLTSDILKSRRFSLRPSAIKTINGEDTVDFLTKYAALNSVGNVEPHADWNALFDHPALDIQGVFTWWTGRATFYQGDDLNFVLENGTQIASRWRAFYHEMAYATGPLETGGDFYNYFVLGLLPASYGDASTRDPNSNTPIRPVLYKHASDQTNWYNDSFHGFPSFTDVHQSGLGVADGGVLTGYFFDDMDVAVLSVPSFDQDWLQAQDFMEAVDNFTDASRKKPSRCLIDLQQNRGGSTLLPYFMFKKFFPDQVPFGGSRRRSFAMANLLGSVTTDLFGSPGEAYDKESLEANEWVITDRLNAATGRSFTSWAEYQGPLTANGDLFSLTERYDLANRAFSAAAFDGPLSDDDYLRNQSGLSPSMRPFGDAGNVVLLLDGLCSSACSLFVEMMTRAGVRTVVMGGRPAPGPMQAASGSRGATAYSADQLDADFAFARRHDLQGPEGVNATLPAARDSGLFTLYAGFNLRDQVRRDEPAGLPLQFRYEAADCRLYYTLQNAYNMTRQWRDAVAATYIDQSLCVAGSTGYSARNGTTPKPALPAAAPSQPVPEHMSLQHEPALMPVGGGLHDTLGKPGNIDISFCYDDHTCPHTKSECRTLQLPCSDQSEKSISLCLPWCSNKLYCRGEAACMEMIGSGSGSGSKNSPEQDVNFEGLCVPTSNWEHWCSDDKPLHDINQDDDDVGSKDNNDFL